MDFLGRHLVADLYDCEPALLDDLERLEAAMRAAAHAAGTTVLQAALHRFSPQGITGVLVLSESHLSLHSWPERGYAAVDIFTCGLHCRPEAAIARLAEALACGRSEVRVLERGAQLSGEQAALAPGGPERRRTG